MNCELVEIAYRSQSKEIFILAMNLRDHLIIKIIAKEDLKCNIQNIIECNSRSMKCDEIKNDQLFQHIHYL